MLASSSETTEAGGLAPPSSGAVFFLLFLHLLLQIDKLWLDIFSSDTSQHVTKVVERPSAPEL